MVPCNLMHRSVPCSIMDTMRCGICTWLQLYHPLIAVHMLAFFSSCHQALKNMLSTKADFLPAVNNSIDSNCNCIGGSPAPIKSTLTRAGSTRSSQASRSPRMSKDHSRLPSRRPSQDSVSSRDDQATSTSYRRVSTCNADRQESPH